MPSMKIISNIEEQGVQAKIALRLTPALGRLGINPNHLVQFWSKGSYFKGHLLHNTAEEGSYAFVEMTIHKHRDSDWREECKQKVFEVFSKFVPQDSLFIQLTPVAEEDFHTPNKQQSIVEASNDSIRENNEQRSS